MRVRTFAVVALAALTISAVVALAPASAQDEVVIEIPLTDVRAPEGSSTEISRHTVRPERVGLSCSVQIEIDNNSSVHPGNDLIVSSGSDSVRLTDVEGFAGKVTLASSDLVLGPEIIITLVMGPDERFSAGLIGIGCNGDEPPPPPPTEPPTPPTEPPVTTEPPIQTTSTTTAPPTTTTEPEVLGETETPPASPPPTAVDNTPTFTG